MDKIGGFSLVNSEYLHAEESYLVAHFYYGQGYYSEWYYVPKKKRYEHCKRDTSAMYKPDHICDTKKEMHYIMLTCIGPCCCPNDEMKKERMSKYCIII